AGATGGTASSAGGANGGGGAPGGGGAGGAVGAGADAGAIALPRPSAAVISAAMSAPLSSYHRSASGDIWCTPCDGAPIILAAAAFAGDTSVDTRLLLQMREVLATGKNPFATGTYAANDERNATAMYAIAKRIPRIWNQLSEGEAHKVDLIME